MLPNQVVIHPWLDVLLLPSLIVMVSLWREPPALQQVVASAGGKAMLGKRQLSGWTVTEGYQFLAAIDDVDGHGLQLYHRYNTFFISFVFTLMLALQASMALRRQGHNAENGDIATIFPLIFFCCNLIQDRCILIIINNYSKTKIEEQIHQQDRSHPQQQNGISSMATIATICTWATRFKISSLLLCLLSAPFRLIEAGMVAAVLIKLRTYLIFTGSTTTK